MLQKTSQNISALKKSDKNDSPKKIKKETNRCKTG